MGCHALLQGIVLTQGLNLHLLWLLPRRQIVYCWAIGEAPVQIIIFQRVQQGEPKLNTVRVGVGNSTQLSLQFEFNFKNFEGHTSFSLQRSPLSSSPKRWVHLNVPSITGVYASWLRSPLRWQATPRIKSHSLQRGLHVRTRTRTVGFPKVGLHIVGHIKLPAHPTCLLHQTGSHNIPNIKHSGGFMQKLSHNIPNIEHSGGFMQKLCSRRMWLDS